jgi:hypothetical protein
MLYRALKKLSIGVAAGAVFNVNVLKPAAREKLENAGIIAPVHAPPLNEIWPGRVDALFRAGINCFEELILASNLSPELRGWQGEALKLLSPGPKQDCHCRKGGK